MEKKKLNIYFFIGQTIRTIQTTEIHHRSQPDKGVFYDVQRLVSALDEVGLTVSMGVAEKFLGRMREWSPNGDFIVNDSKKKFIERNIRSVFDCMNSEMNNSFVFSLTQKQFDVNNLMSDMPKIIGVDVYEKLPGLAKYDFDEAGKCIAFERSTAAAFHLMRCTECVLNSFYEKHKKQKRLKNRMWGPIASELRSLRSPPQKVLLDHLDNIRSNFRNPTQHPEKIYDLSEAQNLLHVCIDVISRMVTDKKW